MCITFLLNPTYVSHSSNLSLLHNFDNILVFLLIRWFIWFLLFPLTHVSMFSLELSKYFLPLHFPYPSKGTIIDRLVFSVRNKNRLDDVTFFWQRMFLRFLRAMCFFPIRSHELYYRFIIFRVTRGTSEYKKLKILVQKRHVELSGVLFIPSLAEISQLVQNLKWKQARKDWLWHKHKLCFVKGR